jgi:hypothetical protein
MEKKGMQTLNNPLNIVKAVTDALSYAGVELLDDGCQLKR